MHTLSISKAPRQFPVVMLKRTADSNPQKASQIRCSDCNTTDHVTSSKSALLPDQIIQQKFTQAGWFVGKTRSLDVCPECLKRRRVKPEPAPKPKEDEPKVNAKPQIPLPFIAPSNVKRAINKALHEQYDADRGYKPGSSDVTIARALEVSPALVAQIREELHGSIAHNDDMAELLARADTLLSLQADIERRCNALVTEITDLKRLLAELRPQLAEIQHVAELTRKAVTPA